MSSDLSYGTPFKCPICKKVSHNPNDKINSYCGNCHQFTGDGYVEPEFSEKDSPSQCGQLAAEATLLAIAVAAVVYIIRRVREIGMTG